jgi:PKD repeat protein
MTISPSLALALALPSLLSGTSTVQDPTVIFSTPGQQTVTLKACNSGGCSTVTKTVTVLDPAPMAGPIIGPTTIGLSSGPVTYTATASGKPPLGTSWTQTAPDSSTLVSSAPSLSLTPRQIGLYNLKFQALNFSGSSHTSLAVTSVPTVFTDVGPNDFASSFIETLYFAGITSGCGFDPATGTRTYCPSNTVSRAELAIFIEVAAHGAYNPPPAVGVFADVPPSYWAAPWIEQDVRDHSAFACVPGTHPLYCPSGATTREYMAFQVVQAAHGPSYTPPPITGVFADVPRTDPLAPWVEQLYRDGATGGCQTWPVRLFCPNSTLTRAEMAVFMVLEFHLAEHPTPSLFAARLCSSTSCTYPVGMPIEFDVQLHGGIPAAYEYDWDGNGTYEEVASFPVSHIYPTAGTFTPRLRLRLGPWTSVLTHPHPIRINSSSGLLSPPYPVAATQGRSVPPTNSDPPGTPVRTAYAISTPAQTGVLGYAAYLDPGTGSFTFVGLLQPDRSSAMDSLLLPAPVLGVTRFFYLRPFTATTFGSASFPVRVP